MRIVTLLPSATEIVCALGLRDQLVGVSHSCNYPEDVADLPVMTSTHVPHEKSSGEIDQYVREHLTGHEALYDLDLDALRKAAPDVIVSQTLCDVCAVSTGDVLAALRDLPSQPQLVDLEPNTLDDVFNDILNVGEILGVPDRARDLVESLTTRRATAAKRTAAIPRDQRPRVAFLEWLDPPFNGGHWNPELVSLAGGIDLLGAPGKPSSTQNWDEIIAEAPDVLYIACCGFRVDRALEDITVVSQRPEWSQMPAVRNDQVYVTDGNAWFSCPGPRLLDGMEVMAHALHPSVHPKLWSQAPFQP